MTVAAGTPIRFDWVARRPDEEPSNGPRIQSPAFRSELYDFVDDFLNFVRRQADLPDWYLSPIDVLEASRIELMMTLRAPIRDWTAWRRMLGLGAPEVDVFVATEARDLLADDLRRTAPPVAVRFRAAESVEPAVLRRRFLGLRLWAHRFVDRAESRWAPRRQAPAADDSRSRAMFLDQHSNSTQVVIPVWNELSKRDDFQCLYVAGRRKIERALAERGIAAFNLRRGRPYVAERELSPPQWPTLVERYFQSLTSRTGAPAPPSVVRRFTDAGTLLADVKLTALRLEHVFQRFRPDFLFVSSGAHVPARVAELLSRRHNCTSFHLQHGIYTGDKETRNLLADAICVWGEFHRRRMERNPPAGELLVTGSPKHDDLRQRYADAPQADRPLVVFYSSRSGSWVVGPDDFERHLEAVYAAARSLPDVDFVVKLHPGESKTVVERLCGDAARPTNLRATQSDNAYELLQQCRLAVTVSSTIGYEALLFRRPLMILNLTGRPCQLPLPDDCRAVHVTSSEALPDAVRRVLADPDSYLEQADDFWMTDGRALERILARAVERRRASPPLPSSTAHA